MRRISRKRLLLAVALAALLAAGMSFYAARAVGGILAAFTAKVLCSCVFVSGLEPARCLAEDAAPYGAWTTTAVDREARVVSSSLPLGAAARAEYREGLGCRLMSRPRRSRPSRAGPRAR